MCMGLPMQVAESGAGYALCNYQGGVRRIDTMLVGDQPPGTWLLVFIDAAREVIDAQEAQKITDALSALDAVMAGGPADIDHLFADIIENSAANRKEPT
ncbi:HypC/HybG/HupF family hydrogenase formation chaperone [Alisedimentitalea sp. MJ-SS2]|uniref:HypC/HybG/HupF family hydrogenase formation chaperone n=1 Tax=Aliisedimentitalea sp. MJ-SS2 TaxID=3049795 RepID=UPI00290730C4|nr:HypC/HybG/HupF family hydrogenase formation chaperone [Alisedimentitalea sp. MJ-SS2]MDU8929647.1 HypC/HybG/HupF family hydrogenase formation chaperone [Alisedimentitalea sp. MJ-SS2]